MSLLTKPVKVAFVIPALNESEAISGVVMGVSFYGKAIVVDDGSTDETGKLARTAGAIVVTHDINYGYDTAIASGLARAIAEGFDIAITVDGDGQHDPSIIDSVLQEFREGADLIVGVRDKMQRVSEMLFGGITEIFWNISDPLCGMKGYRLSRLKAIGDLNSYLSIGTELTIRAARSKWEIRQVRVATYERKGISRFGSNFYANCLILRAMIFGLLWAKAYSSSENY